MPGIQVFTTPAPRPHPLASGITGFAENLTSGLEKREAKQKEEQRYNELLAMKKEGQQMDINKMALDYAKSIAPLPPEIRQSMAELFETQTGISLDSIVGMPAMPPKPSTETYPMYKPMEGGGYEKVFGRINPDTGALERVQMPEGYMGEPIESKEEPIRVPYYTRVNGKLEERLGILDRETNTVIPLTLPEGGTGKPVDEGAPGTPFGTVIVHENGRNMVYAYDKSTGNKGKLLGEQPKNVDKFPTIHGVHWVTEEGGKVSGVITTIDDQGNPVPVTIRTNLTKEGTEPSITGDLSQSRMALQAIDEWKARAELDPTVTVQDLVNRIELIYGGEVPVQAIKAVKSAVDSTAAPAPYSYGVGDLFNPVSLGKKIIGNITAPKTRSFEYGAPTGAGEGTDEKVNTIKNRYGL